MDRKEDILVALEEFNRNTPPKVPDLLERYLQRIAVTGETLFEWDKVKPLFLNKLEVCMKEFNTQISSDLFLSCRSLEKPKLDEMRKRLLDTAETFTGAPFTIQRLCELVTDPYKHYKRTDKFLRGIEKNVLIVSTVDPFGRKVISESYKYISNGVQDDAMDEPSELRTPEKVCSPFLPPPPTNSPCTTDWFSTATTSDTHSPLLSSWQQGGGGDAPSATITSEATPVVGGSRMDHNTWESGFDDYLHSEGPPEKKARFSAISSSESRSEPSQSCVDYFSQAGLRSDKSEVCDSMLDLNSRPTLGSDSCLNGVSTSVLSASVSSTEPLTHSATDSIPTDSLSKIQSTVDSITTHVRHSIGESLAESGVTSLSPSECLPDEDTSQLPDDKADDPEPTSHCCTSQEELADRRESQGFDVCPLANSDSSDSAENSNDAIDNSSNIADSADTPTDFTTENIADSVGKSSDIADSVVNSSDIADSVVNSSDIADSVVNSSDIADSVGNSSDTDDPVGNSSDIIDDVDQSNITNESPDISDNISSNTADCSPSQSSSHSQSPASEPVATDVSSSSELVQSSSAISTIPDNGEPISTVPDSGEPISTAPDSGEPISTAPDSGEPISTVPDSGEPISTAPDNGEPISTAPDSGEPISTAPDSGKPSAAPDNGEPTTAPDSGEPRSDKHLSSEQPDDGSTEVIGSSSTDRVTEELVADSCTEESSEAPESSDSEAIPSTNDAAMCSEVEEMQAESVGSSFGEPSSTSPPATSSADTPQQHEDMDTA